MEKMVYSKKELVEMFGCSELSIWRMEQDRRLKRLHNLPGCMYRAKEVEKLLQLDDDVDPLSPFERRRLEHQVENLREENKALRKRLSQISAMALGEGGSIDGQESSVRI